MQLKSTFSNILICVNIVLMFVGGVYRIFGFSYNIITHWKLFLSFIVISGIVVMMAVYYRKIKVLDENLEKAILMEINKSVKEKKQLTEVTDVLKIID